MNWMCIELFNNKMLTQVRRWRGDIARPTKYSAVVKCCRLGHYVGLLDGWGPRNVQHYVHCSMIMAGCSRVDTYLLTYFEVNMIKNIIRSR